VKRKHLADSAAAIRAAAKGDIACAIVLGSGLGRTFSHRVENATVIPYKKLAGMPETTVAGHMGVAIVGTIAGRRVLVFSGRFHLYEGHDARAVVAPVLLAAAAGAQTIVLTNAAGGLNTSYAAGDVMIVRDHLNFTGVNPLAGEDLLLGTNERFVDMADAYDPHLAAAGLRTAEAAGRTIRHGVYVGLMGPSYETIAEAKWLAAAGADAVGMSTVLETIAARALGLRVLGISAITNMLDGKATSHEEVLTGSQATAEHVADLIVGVIGAPEFGEAASS
jgi:purine-nucleoside phosphorylase